MLGKAFYNVAADGDYDSTVTWMNEIGKGMRHVQE